MNQSASALLTPDRHKARPAVEVFATEGIDLCPEGVGAGARRGFPVQLTYPQVRNFIIS